MRAVNLLPRDETPRSFEAKRGVAFGAAGGAAFVSVLLATAIISAGGGASEQQAELDTINAELQALPKGNVESAATDDALAAEKAARIGALSSALGSRVAWDRVLRQISQVLPQDVWLTSVTSTSIAPMASNGAQIGDPVPGVVLNGSTYSQDGVARVLARLAVTPALANVELQSSTLQPVGARDVVQFAIRADLRTAGSPS